MIALGKINQLVVGARQGAQYTVNAGEWGDVVLQDVAAEACEIGATIPVFVYLDGKQQLQASAVLPAAQAGEVAWLKVVAVNNTGAFLDWGLSKNLLLPYSEQRGRVKEGHYCLVRLFLDEDNRVAATMMLDDFIRDQAFYYQPGQQVQLMIAEVTDLGFKAIVDHQYWGVLYRDEVFQPLRQGQSLQGYIKTVRPDHKLDLILSVEKYGRKVDAAGELVLNALKAHNGYLPLCDKSDPQVIYQQLGVSKKVFKQAIGSLYKQKLIVIEERGIRLGA
jgi:uncharacterized protein